MLTDRHNGLHSTVEQTAVSSFDAAVTELLAHRPNVMPHLDAALAADPDHIASLALKGFGSVLLARSEHVASARVMAARLKALTDRRRPTAFEAALVAALDLASRGAWRDATSVLQQRLAECPIDLLSLKLVHALRFMSGDASGMLASTASVLDAWSAAAPGYGFMLGCHAFALEEHCLYESAERTARIALAHEPGDAWALHALAHVHVMQGRFMEGFDWLDATKPVWSGCNNFRFHLIWHGALLHLARGDADRALAIYDADLRPHLADDFRDLANASSLLWRLRQEGMDVRDRFEELHGFASARAQDTTLVFASLHHLLTMAACGDAGGASEIVAALVRRGARPDGDQAAVAADAGLDLARVILSLAQNGATRPDLGRLAQRAQCIGGSNEQRDVFLRTLALMAADAGDARNAGAILDLRRRMKREQQFATLAERRLAETLDSHRVVA